jgi:hypothetical protein
MLSILTLDILMIISAEKYGAIDCELGVRAHMRVREREKRVGSGYILVMSTSERVYPLRKAYVNVGLG